MADLDKVKWPGWETVKLIGRGSFGSVYEIERDFFGEKEKAALKVISIPQNDSDIDELYSEDYDEETITSMFQSHLKSIMAEYSLMRKMNGNSNIVNCDDVRYIQHDNSIGWNIYIKMELLTPLMKDLPTDIEEDTVVKIAKDICSALILCKKHNIVHRDIKPQNIFVSPNGDYKLGDFGIAKTVEKTMGGTKTGTYKYMAPEVYNNQPYGSAADIYSLGMVLYWLLNAKRVPFLPLPPEKIKAGMEEEARRRRFLGEEIPEPLNGSKELKQIVLKSCAFDPKDRYASAAEMLEDLNSIGKKVVVAESPVKKETVKVEEVTVIENIKPEIPVKTKEEDAKAKIRIEEKEVRKTSETIEKTKESESASKEVKNVIAEKIRERKSEKNTDEYVESTEDEKLTDSIIKDEDYASSNDYEYSLFTCTVAYISALLMIMSFLLFCHWSANDIYDRTGLRNVYDEFILFDPTGDRYLSYKNIVNNESDEENPEAQGLIADINGEDTDDSNGDIESDEFETEEIDTAIPVSRKTSIVSRFVIISLLLAFVSFGCLLCFRNNDHVYVWVKEYYLNKSGIKQTYYKYINGKIYYFDEKGEKQTGRQTIVGKEYYFNENGAMLIGFNTINTINENIYYFDENGQMQTGWQTIDGDKYYFDQSGEMQTGLKTINGKTYYFDENGVMLTGLQTFGGKEYYFDVNGVLKEEK